jgi:hypothetical protein
VYRANGCLGDAVSRANLCLCTPDSEKDVNDGRVVRGESMSAATLHFFVTSVFGMGPVKQVVGVLAQWVIAAVTCVSLGIPPVVQKERRPAGNRWLATDVKDTVSVVADPSRP